MSSAEPTLHEVLSQQIPGKQAELKELKETSISEKLPIIIENMATPKRSMSEQQSLSKSLLGW